MFVYGTIAIMTPLPDRTSDSGPDRHGCQHAGYRILAGMIMCSGCGATYHQEQREWIPLGASRQDSALVVAMAEQALEDADCVTEMIDAGCSFDECRAAFSDGKVAN